MFSDSRAARTKGKQATQRDREKRDREKGETDEIKDTVNREIERQKKQRAKTERQRDTEKTKRKRKKGRQSTQRTQRDRANRRTERQRKSRDRETERTERPKKQREVAERRRSGSQDDDRDEDQEDGKPSLAGVSHEFLHSNHSYTKRDRANAQRLKTQLEMINGTANADQDGAASWVNSSDPTFNLAFDTED